MSRKKVVVIGGGTGTYAVLSGLKHYNLDISAIITMMDSGGSTGRLRDQYGVLPPGDIRQALVALSESDLTWRKLFLYRFDTGDLKGHNFGNIFLTTLEKVTHDFEKSIEVAEEILKTKGVVIPVTLHKTHIQAKLIDGTFIHSEALIDEKVQRSPIDRLTLQHDVECNPKAIRAIAEADLIVVGPGDLYTSLIPNFLFKNIVQTYIKSKSPRVFIANLMNKTGQTDGFGLSEYIEVFEKYLGPSPFSGILVNNAEIQPEVIRHYEKNGESPVKIDVPDNTKTALYKKDFISDHIYASKKGDILDRSLLRHDSRKVARFLWETFLK